MGIDPIMSFTDNTKVASVVSNIYTTILSDVLSLEEWNFAATRVSLNQLATNAQSDIWAYAYAEPTNIITIQSLRDSYDQVVNYEELQNVIYSQLNPVFLRYIYYTPGMEPTFPPYFIQALVYRFAMELCVPLMGNPQMYQFYSQQYQAALTKAMAMNSIRGTPQYVDQSVWLEGLWLPQWIRYL